MCGAIRLKRYFSRPAGVISTAVFALPPAAQGSLALGAYVAELEQRLRQDVGIHDVHAGVGKIGQVDRLSRVEDCRAVCCTGVALVEIHLAESGDKRSIEIYDPIMDHPAGSVARQLSAAGCSNNECRHLTRRQVVEVEPCPDSGAKVQADYAAQRVAWLDEEIAEIGGIARRPLPPCVMRALEASARDKDVAVPANEERAVGCLTEYSNPCRERIAVALPASGQVYIR